MCPSQEFQAGGEIKRRMKRTVQQLGALTGCNSPDVQRVNILQLRHVSEDDFLCIGTLNIPTKWKPTETKWKNLKKSFPVLNRHIVPRVEAYGACFCWKIYSKTNFRGEVQIVSEGDEIDIEINVGSIEKVLCSDLEDYDDYY